MLVYGPADVFSVTYFDISVNDWEINKGPVTAAVFDDSVWLMHFHGEDNQIVTAVLYKTASGQFIPDKKSYYKSLRVNANTRLRAQPSTNAPILKTIQEGDSIDNMFKLSQSMEVIDGARDFWYYVSSGYDSGWIFGKYIDPWFIGK